jgi:hypothetical protein
MRLRQGITQSILVEMFDENRTQQDISRYIDTMRRAIKKDFVQMYLGANKSRGFYLSDNTKSASILHELEDDILQSESLLSESACNDPSLIKSIHNIIKNKIHLISFLFLKSFCDELVICF